MKPILFNTEMVKAILDGRKNVTRRVVKHDIEAILNSPFHKQNPDVTDIQIINKLCTPPYQIGDILYVRETWTNDKLIFGKNVVSNYLYKADGDMEIVDNAGREVSYKWRPSLHMPKEAARIFLKVIEVRVERLQAITIDEIRKEGLSSMAVHAGDKEIAYKEWQLLWDSTIDKKKMDQYGWDANPWVWVIEFDKEYLLEKENDYARK